MQLFLIGLAENGCKFTFYVLKFIRIEKSTAKKSNGKDAPREKAFGASLSVLPRKCLSLFAMAK